MNNSQKLTADKTAILASLDAMFGPNDIIELRAIQKNPKKISAGYFDDKHREQLADAAVCLNNAGATVYVTMNQIDPQLLGRYPNQIQEYAKSTTTDKDIIKRRWLLVDIDPVREPDTNATKEQMDAAYAKVKEVAAYLCGKGWPKPTIGMSGNGFHIYYPIDLPNDNESRELVKGALAGLAAKFSNDFVKIDQCVFNAARITKLFGTIVNKGQHTEQTPRRKSRLMMTPKRDKVVASSLLQSQASVIPAAMSNTTHATGESDNFDLAVKIKPSHSRNGVRAVEGNAGLAEVVSQNKALVTIINSSERATKRFSLEKDVTLKKESACAVYKGYIEVKSADTPIKLVKIIENLNQHQTLTFGIPRTGYQAKLGTKKSAQGKADIARTKEDFKWNEGPGWLMLDYDPAPEVPPLTKKQWLNCLYEAAPMLRNAPAVWNVSASSEIWNTETNEQLQGVRGQRLYIKVADARDIPRAGKALFDRLWLAGHGYYLISSSGQMLKRTHIDASVWQAERLDFAATPVCESPLETRRPNPEVFNDHAAPLNTEKALADISQEERDILTKKENIARNDSKLGAERQLAIKKWLDKRINGLNKDEAENHKSVLLEALNNKQLYGDFKLIHSSGKTVTVTELLNNPDQWHGECFHDPLEPEYSNSDPRIAKVNLKSGSKSYIWSFAHGGTRYVLNYQAEKLQIRRGDKPAIIDAILRRFRLNTEIYEHGNTLTRLVDNELVKVEHSWLLTYIEKNFLLERSDRDNNQPKKCDCPADIPARILQARGEWGLPKVTGVVTYPVMRRDFSLLINPGHDIATGLLHVVNEEIPQPKVLTGQSLITALKRIWEPFQLFPFESDLDRGVFLSALLTTVCRPALETAPAFLIRAHSAGTGKTLLSECLMLLVDAPLAAMPLPTGNNEEIEKRLFSQLLAAKPGVILDNLTGVIDNAAMCVFLTSELPSGRILGKSELLSIPNRTLWVLNGNNVSAGGDTYRRILPCTLDANHEAPETRSFSFNPKNEIKNRLTEYRLDLLSVLKTFKAANAPRMGKGSFGSFEDWECIGRQCVCWLINEGVLPVEMADPLGVLKHNKQEDPLRQQHGNLMVVLYKCFKDNVVYAKNIVHEAENCTTGIPLHEALKEIFPESKPLNANLLGKWLRDHKGQIVDGLRIDSAKKSNQGIGWKVSRVKRCNNDMETVISSELSVQTNDDGDDGDDNLLLCT